MTIRVLLVDDEAPARAKLRKLLAPWDDLEIVGEAADGREAVTSIRKLLPDLVFLDIQMPGLDGFGVVGEVGVDAMPLVVFATAYDQHALRAFEVHAFDYLLKPYAPTRFRAVVERVRGRLGAADADRSSALGALLQEVGAARPGHLKRLRLASGPQREVLLPVEEIRCVRADGNYLAVHATGGRTLRRRGTLAELEERLDPDDFRRINRSEIVRLGAIREIQPWFRGDARVVLDDGEILSWSRRYRHRGDDFELG